MTIQSNEFVRTNIKETKQTTHDFDFKPFFAIQELGVPTTTSFCGGRTDASNDDGYSDFLSVGSSKLHLIKYFWIATFLFLSQSCDMTSLTMLNNWRRWSGWWGSPRSSSPLSSSTSLLSFSFSNILLHKSCTYTFLQRDFAVLNAAGFAIGEVGCKVNLHRLLEITFVSNLSNLGFPVFSSSCHHSYFTQLDCRATFASGDQAQLKRVLWGAAAAGWGGGRPNSQTRSSHSEKP